MDTAHELDMTLDEQLIKDLAGSRAFFRGVGYLQDGRIASVESRGDRVVATVRGTVPYGVELRLVDDVIGWTCSCPAAEDGSFCKHCAGRCAVAGAPRRAVGRERIRPLRHDRAPVPRQPRRRR